MTNKEQQREYRTVSYLVSTLANICTASPNMVIDALTGILWDEEEVGQIKVAKRQKTLTLLTAALGIAAGSLVQRRD